MNSLAKQRASSLWREAKPITGTIAREYLATRGIFDFAPEVDGKVLRFHPSCPYDGSRHPCLLALMRDVVTDEPRAIQRTALTSKGKKLVV